MQETQDLFINGQWVTGQAGTIESTNPATGEVIWVGHAADQFQASTAIQAARAALPVWSNLSFEQRYMYLAKFVQELTTQQELLVKFLSQEHGKPLWEAKTEISAMLGKLDISKQAYLERCKEVSKETNNVITYTRFKPHGVILVLGPFNLPGHLPNSHIIPALLAGNTVVYKPSELTPLISYKIMQCWEKAGLPNGVLNMLQGDGTLGRYLVENPDIDGIFFTGSSATGIKIQAANLDNPQKILALEMGGNNPLVVYKPSDINAAVYLTIQSAFITSGQRCTCARRLIVVKNAAGEQFVQRLITVIKQIKVGPCTDQPEPFMGPMISKSAADNILSAYQRLVGFGGQVLVAMTRSKSTPALLTPSLIDVTNINELPDEEIFGPLLCLIWVDDIDQAISVANNTKYGLAAGLLSNDADLYKKFLQQVNAGIINWNRPTTGSSSSAPFGGIGWSGNHRPSAYFAADYCAYPVASSEETKLKLPETLSPGINL